MDGWMDGGGVRCAWRWVDYIRMKGYYVRQARRLYPHDQYEQTLAGTGTDTGTKGGIRWRGC